MPWVQARYKEKPLEEERGGFTYFSRLFLCIALARKSFLELLKSLSAVGKIDLDSG